VIAGLLVAITLSGAHKLWPFLAIGAVAGIASALTNPAGRSLTPEIVSAELLPGAVALRSVATQAGIVVGPAIGGVIFAVEPVAVYITAATLFAVGVVTILGVSPPLAAAPAETGLSWQSLSAGIGFIVRTKMLLGAISLDLFAVLLGDSIALAPVFARSILHVGPAGLRWAARGALRRRAPGWPAPRPSAAPEARRADAARGRRRLRRGDDRVRLFPVCAAVARRARSERLRGHDQHEHPLHHRVARDAARAARTR